MAVSVARTEAAAPALPRVRVAALPWLALIVVASAAARIAAGWLKATPVYLPDEYMYSELGRSLAESARPLVRGVEAAFPSLLQPMLTAPFWLIEDVELAYRLVQALGAVAMSLAAPAAFLLARRCGLSRGLALGAAAVAVTVPDMLYAGWLLAEPFAYPIVLGAIATGVAALERPSPRMQLAFVALAGLAVFARAQFAILPLCFVAAAFVVDRRAALRTQRLPLALFATPLVLALAVGRERVLGIYSAPFGGEAGEVLAFSNWAAPNLLVLVYMAGFALVPGAVLGLALALARPRSRGELAFAALATTLAVALLAESALFGALHVVQERYVFYLVPLLAVAFGLYVSRGWPHRRAHALLALGLLAVSARWPLAGFAAAEGKQHAPSLIALSRLEVLVGEPGLASLAVAAVGGLLCLAAAAAPYRPRVGVAVGFGAAVALGTAGWLGAVQWDVGNASRIARAQLGPDPSWIAKSGLRDVTLVRSFDAQRVDAIQMFWNRNVDRVVLLQGAEPLDPFTNERVAVRRDGALVVGGAPLASPLLVEEHAVTVRLTGARRVGGSPLHTLYRPAGTPRLALYMIGRYWDGWLRGGGGVNLWAPPGKTRLAGWLTLAVRAPRATGPTTLTFGLPDGGEHSVGVSADGWTRVRVPVCGGTSWQSEFQAADRGWFDGRVVSVRSTAPVFRLDAKACRPTSV